MTIYTNDQVEKWVKDEYIDFLKDACLSKEDLDKIRNATFIFGADVPSSRYDADDNVFKISSGDMGSDWDSLSRALMHEFGHFISDMIIDPTTTFVSGYPLFGKYVGGKHNNWVPNEKTDNWGPDIDADQLAFEEGMVDFLAAQYFASKGIVYQDDLNTPDKALEVLSQLGRDKSTRIEGVVTSFLNEYYKNQSESGPKGPAQAVGDFMRAATYDPRHGYTWLSTPARTINEFIDAKKKSDQNDPKNECSPGEGQAGDLSGLAGKYGFDGKNQPIIKFRPNSESQANTIATTIDGMTFANPEIDSIQNLIPIYDTNYEFPPGTAPIIEIYPNNYPSDSDVERIAFDPETLNIFSVDPANVLNLQQGNAFVENSNVNTPNLNISHVETEYLVKVIEGEELVETISGQINLADKSGSHESVTIPEGRSVVFSTDEGFEIFETGNRPSSSKSISWIFGLLTVFTIAILTALKVFRAKL
ncbi:hypothetical protein GF354_05300 [Candidatus Peregrinibacteria bacterium]|nr:hypothetical protein [Candidatus Peregrinibacteria bacterium]